jgi:nucleoside-triphosphatase THEP1
MDEVGKLKCEIKELKAIIKRIVSPQFIIDEFHRLHYKNNKKAIKQRAKEYYWENREKIREKNKKYYYDMKNK